jgi:hypothetical protein
MTTDQKIARCAPPDVVKRIDPDTREPGAGSRKK